MSSKGRNCANCGRFFKEGADWSKYCKNVECNKKAVKVVEAIAGPSVVIKTNGGNTTLHGSDTKVTETYQMADGSIMTKQTTVPTVIKSRTMNAQFAPDLTAPSVTFVQNSLTTQTFTPDSITTTVHNPVATSVVQGTDGSIAMSTTSVPVHSVTMPNQQLLVQSQIYPSQQQYQHYQGAPQPHHTPQGQPQCSAAAQQPQQQYPQGYPPGYQHSTQQQQQYQVPSQNVQQMPSQYQQGVPQQQRHASPLQQYPQQQYQQPQQPQQLQQPQQQQYQPSHQTVPQ